ncbi:MAG TPA: RagB/SusD family nutrient uptake outer membrane protein [Prolixibacteraceae bacterium]|nr:RagB/SusD family nutrient uptake outer membrane protein [Prolixibacteraceae bacterium]
MKTKILSFLILLGVLVSSCDLSEEPYGFYSDDNFYKTQADAESALMYAYNAFTFLEYTRGITNIGDLPTETTDLKPSEGQDAQEMLKWTAGSTNITLANYFKYCYIAINRANAVLENVEDADFPSEVKNRILGEAHMVRAWAYFSLVRVFGVVPIQKEMVKTVAQTTPSLAANLDEVYDFIIADLMFAEGNLGLERKIGRFDRAAAWSVLSKVYLNIASSKENDVAKYRDMAADIKAMYTEAANWAGKVINDQKAYGFDPNLFNIYNVDFPDGPEHIWLINMDRTGQNEGNYSKTPLMFMPWGDGQPFYVKLQDGTLVYTTNGWEVYSINNEFLTTFDTHDKRRTELMQNAIYDADGNEVGSVASGKIPGVYSIKYIDPHFVGQKTSVKPFMIRFTDIALTYAEAEGPSAEGYKWINVVRQRAGLEPLAPGLSIADFRKAVLQERTWELAYEGHHLYDLRRTASVISSIPAAKNVGLTEDEAAFYPIPQLELDLNPNINK